MTLGELLRALPSLGDGNELPVYVTTHIGEMWVIGSVDVAKDHIGIRIDVTKTLDEAYHGIASAEAR
jgi:hypothetical protein